MLVVMAVDTEIFPVGAVRRVVQVISVLMVYCKKVSRFLVELPATSGTDEAMYL